MVTVVKNPQGLKIVGSPVTASITNGAGFAKVTKLTHGLYDSLAVYVESDIDEYNGFWWVEQSGGDPNNFYLLDAPTSGMVEYYQDATITYYHTKRQDWSSVFLPIVYKLSNDKWPTNTVDTVRTISSTADDNSYLDITASGVIKVGMNILEYVKISNSPVAAYNGVWQIVEVVSSSRVIIDAPYTASSLAGANIQYYYNNYQVKVKIYAGLPSGHPWESKKPYEEMAELSITPDENNEVMFSVADKIQGKVAVRNNTTLYSLPLNLDAFTGYYISTAESYDESDNYSLATAESEFTDDTFEGYAIAGKLPFKNVYSGHYSDYVYVDGSPALWLTSFPRLIALEDRYFDVSFIKNVEGDFILQIDKYIADYRADSEDIEYTDQGVGVYRIPIVADGGYDSFCVSIRPASTFEDISLPALNTWGNGTATSELDWTIGSAPSVEPVAPGGSEILSVDYAFIPGKTYRVTFNFTLAGLGTFMQVSIRILDSSHTTLFSEVNTLPAGLTYDRSIEFTATASTTKIGISGLATTGSPEITLNSVSGEIETDQYYLTEEICIDIISCNPSGGGLTETFYRLLEDNDTRITESGDSRVLE